MVETMTATDVERELAIVVLNEHTDNRGLCAVGGCAFPCDRAVLAEYNLAVL
jgi:hypothetical protein